MLNNNDRRLADDDDGLTDLGRRLIALSKQLTNFIPMKSIDKIEKVDNKKNTVNLIGNLISFTKYSEKVGHIGLQVFDTQNGKHCENHFFCTLFPPFLRQAEEIPTESKVRIEGYLKNVSRQSHGKTIISLDIIVDKVEEIK